MTWSMAAIGEIAPNQLPGYWTAALSASGITRSSVVSDKHEHQFSTWELEPITNVHQDYIGTAGDKAFLVRKCKCNAKISVQYGPTEELKEMLWDVLASIK